MITFTDDQLEILHFGKQRAKSFLAQLRDHFGWRRKTREDALGDFDREIGQDHADLISDHFLRLTETRKNSILHRAHFGTKFHETTVHARVGLTRAFAAAPFKLGGEIRCRVLAHGLDRFGGEYERSGKRNRMTRDSHGIKRRPPRRLRRG